MPREITLKDVAARAGVSRTTASNVMSGAGRFSVDTRERVHRAMRELGYVYNRGAASLRTQRTHTAGHIGLSAQLARQAAARVRSLLDPR